MTTRGTWTWRARSCTACPRAWTMVSSARFLRTRGKRGLTWLLLLGHAGKPELEPLKESVVAAQISEVSHTASCVQARALRCVRLTHPIPPRAAPLAAPPDLLAVGRKGGLREGGGKCALERGPAQRARVLERRQPHCPRHPSGLYPLPSLRARYAMSGSHVAYPPVAPYGAAMPCPVLT